MANLAFRLCPEGGVFSVDVRVRGGRPRQTERDAKADRAGPRPSADHRTNGSTRTEGAMSVLSPPSTAPSRTHAQELEEFRRFKATDDTRTRDGLIERALPLAHQIARRYVRSGDQFDDVLQVARLGLVKAVSRFDPDRGVAFSTYAVPTMVGEIKRHFRDTGWSVHVPRSLQERVLKVEQAEKALSGRLGRAPTVAELAELMELGQEEVLEAMEAGSA